MTKEPNEQIPDEDAACRYAEHAVKRLCPGRHFGPLHLMEAWRDGYLQGRNEGKICMIYCGECHKENWAMAVASGKCAWCGYDPNAPKAQSEQGGGGEQK